MPETSTPRTAPLVCFAHGKESGPWGSKFRHLAGIAQSMGCRVLSPDYSDLTDPEERVKRLELLELPPHGQLILVGSSMGGYVSTVASRVLQPDGLFLLAPAFFIPGYAVEAPEPVTRNTSIVFGWNDEVIPVENAIRFAQHFKTELHLLKGDHRLNTVLPQVGQLFSIFLRNVLSEAADSQE